MRELQITKAEENQRLDKYLKKYLNLAPASFVYKMLRKKNIKLNRQKAEGSELLKNGDQIQLFLAEETIESFREAKKVQKVPLPDVIYEDEHLLFINKPSGLLTQKAVPSDLSLVDEILYYLQQNGSYDSSGSTQKPSVCNRLDRNTSGLVLAGKDLAGLQFLSEVLKTRTLKKEYFCVVQGVMKAPLHLKGYLAKDEKTNTVTVSQDPFTGGSAVETYFTPLSDNGQLTLVKADLITGKTHQIRSHLASVGHPIIGDTKYGNAKSNTQFRRKYQVKSQLLHARYVTFPELSGAFAYLSGKSFEAPLPSQFACCITGENLHE